MGNPELRLSEDEQLYVDDMEYFLTEVHFQRLLDLATEVCLKEPLPVLEKKPGNSLNDKLMQSMGTLGLRVALEITLEQERFYPSALTADEENPTLIPTTLDVVMREPGMFHDYANPKVIAKAEQFGKALINEAFTVLGSDATEHAELLKHGDTEQQIVQIKWLIDRIMALEKEKRGQDKTDTSIVYNPIRLSPKYIGEYPNHELTPTCLSASILVSSFFEKAKVPYMHAGAQEERWRRRLSSATNTLESVSVLLGDSTSAPSPLVAELAAVRAKIARVESEKDEGYHAGVFAKLADGSWMQVDPYVGLDSIELADATSTELSEHYATLKEFETTAPNLQLSYRLGMLAFSDGISEALSEMMTNGNIKDVFPEAMDILLTDTESVHQSIYERYILPQVEDILRKGNEGRIVAGHHSFGHVLASVMNTQESGKHTNVLQEMTYDMFDKYVLWGQAVEEVQARCDRDHRYRRKRMEDLINLPTVICAGLALSDINENYFNIDLHESVELGLPHARVGFAVLSDFAVYCDDILPPSFWAANWPSLIPITELMHRESNDTEQLRHLRNLADWAMQRSLTYGKSSSIISKFLEESDAQLEA